ncbi:hypothetical protein B0H11DRAFT_2083377, partial [Mycena galericulata]
THFVTAQRNNRGTHLFASERLRENNTQAQSKVCSKSSWIYCASMQGHMPCRLLSSRWNYQGSMRRLLSSSQRVFVTGPSMPLRLMMQNPVLSGKKMNSSGRGMTSQMTTHMLEQGFFCASFGNRVQSPLISSRLHMQRPALLIFSLCSLMAGIFVIAAWEEM